MAHDDPALVGNEQIDAWIVAAKAGSASARGRLLQACRAYLVGVARRNVSPALRRKVGDSDLVQETALEAHRSFGTFRGERRPQLLAWLRRILLFNASNLRRHYERTGKRDLSREISLDQSPYFAQNVAADILSPRSLLATIDEMQVVERALDRLPADQRQVIVLHNREHMSFVEIGMRMEKSAEAVRKLWFRGVERLQQQLAAPD